MEQQNDEFKGLDKTCNTIGGQEVTYIPQNSPIDWSKKVDPHAEASKPVTWSITPGGTLASEQPPQVTLDQKPTPLALPKTKSLLTTLDRFLSKGFFSVFVFYFTAAVVLGTALILNNGPKSEASPGGESLLTSNPAPLNYWLWSIIGTLTFVFALVTIYFLARQKHIKVHKRK